MVILYSGNFVQWLFWTVAIFRTAFIVFVFLKKYKKILVENFLIHRKEDLNLGVTHAQARDENHGMAKKMAIKIITLDAFYTIMDWNVVPEYMFYRLTWITCNTITYFNVIIWNLKAVILHK